MISSDRESGEFAISISEDWKVRGLASHLMRLLIEHATAQGLKTLHGDVLRTNTPMQKLMKALNFKSHVDPDEPELMVFTLSLPEEHATIQ